MDCCLPSCPLSKFGVINGPWPWQRKDNNFDCVFHFAAAFEKEETHLEYLIIVNTQSQGLSRRLIWRKMWKHFPSSNPSPLSTKCDRHRLSERERERHADVFRQAQLSQSVSASRGASRTLTTKETRKVLSRCWHPPPHTDPLPYSLHARTLPLPATSFACHICWPFIRKNFNCHFAAGRSKVKAIFYSTPRVASTRTQPLPLPLPLPRPPLAAAVLRPGEWIKLEGHFGQKMLLGELWADERIGLVSVSICLYSALSYPLFFSTLPLRLPHPNALLSKPNGIWPLFGYWKTNKRNETDKKRHSKSYFRALNTVILYI